MRREVAAAITAAVIFALLALGFGIASAWTDPGVTHLRLWWTCLAFAVAFVVSMFLAYALEEM